MNYYFLPDIEGFRTQLTVANFPPVDDAAISAREEIVHVIWSDGARWLVEPLERIAPGDTLTVERSGLPAGVGSDALPFVFMAPETVRGPVASPPVSSRRETSPAWRANLRICAASTCTSFQGEYPSAMTTQNQGSLLSIAPMRQCGEDVKTLLLLINMRSNPARDEAPLEFLRLSDRRKLGEMAARYNAATIVDLDRMAGPEEGTIIISSPAITGIPLFLSFDTGRTALSLEHSHPPTELVAFGDRGTVQRRSKTWWLAGPR